MHLLLALLACKDDPEVLAFPEGFQFGVATAGFQVDPGCPTLSAADCQDEASDWYQWVTDPDLAAVGDLHLSGDPLDLGPGHWELWEEDLDLASESLGVSAYRFSFEWSRLFPDGAAESATSIDALAAQVDPEALAWYHAYLDGVRARGLTPIATINHYTLPLWVHDGRACHFDITTCAARGWVDGDRIVPLIALFSGFLAREFGEDLTWWLTLNEPIAVIQPGYIFRTEDRTNPPGITDMALALTVAWNMARAHVAMADAVRAEDADAQVGVVANLGLALPMEEDDPEDVEGALHLDYIYNQLLLDAFLDGEMDWNLDGVIDEVHPEFAGKTDFLGLNYYFALKVSGFSTPVPGFGDYPYMDFFPSEFDYSPTLIGDAIEMTAQRGLPIWITENGVANPSPADATEFLVPSLDAVRTKAEEGVDLRGYLYWSLIDNYEWNHGMGMTFGLYGVDLDTKARTIRPIGEKYAEIVALGGIPVQTE